MDVYEDAARILADSRNALGFSGAGISAESGIPTFRDPGGIWDQFDPEEFGTVQGVIEVAQRKPEVIRKFMLDTLSVFEQAKPNPAHHALAELEELGIVKAVITQNIDNLHSDAGSKTVYEVHGNLFRARCTQCGTRREIDKQELLKNAREILTEEEFRLDKILTILPVCHCGGFSRPDVVMFGEAVQQLNPSFKLAASCDSMLVLGTSGVVYPAADLPQQAHQAGAKIVEVNPTENSYHPITDVYIREPSAKAMPKVMEQVRKLLEL